MGGVWEGRIMSQTATSNSSVKGVVDTQPHISCTHTKHTCASCVTQNEYTHDLLHRRSDVGMDVEPSCRSHFRSRAVNGPITVASLAITASSIEQSPFID